MAARDIAVSVAHDGLVHTLSRAKFRKKALTFQRRLGDVVQVVDVQLSAGNTAAQARFYLNVGVGFDALWALAGRATQTPWRAHQCHYSRRIADVVPDAPDAWDVDESTHIPTAAVGLYRLVCALVARLDGVISPRTAIDVLLAGDEDLELRARLRYVDGDDDAALADLGEVARRFADRRGMSLADLVQRHCLTRLASRL